MRSVLVTGISGFLGSHIALQLLKLNYRVIGTVRDPAKTQSVEKSLGAACVDLSRLKILQLDLRDDRGWSEAAGEAEYTIHAASPFVLTMPKNANELIAPAVEGTQRVMRAALSAAHERIILTSSLAAISCGHRAYDRVFSERDWTRLDGSFVTSYARSKTLAECEAWRMAAAAGARQRLAVINPATMLGPLLDDDPGTSAALILRMLQGRMPLAPPIILEYADVRDVAAAHVAALTSSVAGGQRHIVSDASLSLMEVAQILRDNFPEHARKLPKRQLPRWGAQVLSLFDKSLRDSAAYLGVKRVSDNARGKALLGGHLIPTSHAIAATALSMIERRLVT